LLSVFAEWLVSLLISVCASLCPRFSVAGLAPSAGSAGAEEREASHRNFIWKYFDLSYLIFVAYRDAEKILLKEKVSGFNARD